VLALQTVPKVAIAPLLIIWFGFGLQSKVLTAALIAFFPVLVNVIAGLRSVDPRRLMLMRALQASPWQTFRKVRLPSMLPYLFAGLEIAMVFSIIGVIVGEFIGSSVGLGVMIIQRQGTIDVAGVFSVLIYLSLLGLVLNAVIVGAKRRLVFW
jgi:NitT/TauT family transport system permease protein